MGPFDRIAAEPVFTVDGYPWTWAHVLAGPDGDSLWAGATTRASTLAPEGADDAQTKAAARRFRQVRGLESADETRAWLAAWALDAADWMSWVAGDTARRAARDTAPTPELVYAEAVCSGALASAARSVAARAALARPGASVDDARAAWADHLAAPIPDDELERAHVTRRAELVEVDWSILRLAGPDPAREVAMCIRDEGMAPDDAARLAGAVWARRREPLAHVPPALRGLIEATRVGDLAEAGAARDTLVVVHARATPALDACGDRLRDMIRARVVERAIIDRVRWCFGPLRGLE